MEEPKLSFHHAELRIVWAEKLIDELRIEIERFIQEKPYTISLKPDPQGSRYLFDVFLTRHIPDAIPCLLADICSNLRASGDTCMMGVIRKYGSPKSRFLLPICDTENGVKTSISNALKGEALSKAMAVLINGIKPHQEFNSGGNYHLFALNKLNNWQKHNMLATVFGVTKLGDNTVIKSNDGSVIHLGGSKVDGHIAAIGGTHAEMTYDSEPTVEVFIRHPGLDLPEPIIPTLLGFKTDAIRNLSHFRKGFI